jgi:hypothetical protein
MAGRDPARNESRSGDISESGIPAGVMAWALADPVAAERYLREAYATLRAMGERRYLVDVITLLADALYAQDRFDEAQQMTDEAQAASPPDVSVGVVGAAAAAPCMGEIGARIDPRPMIKPWRGLTARRAM